MKKAQSNRSVILIAGILSAWLFILAGCKNTQQKQEAGTDTGEVISTEKVVEELSGYPIPTSYEITGIIYESGSPYILSLSNRPEKAGDYITRRDMVLNLGIYSTDLCYATTYMMKQGTMNFLEASKTLIEELGISTTFSVNYAERIEQNIDNRDSLIQIVSESFGDTWNYLIENEQDVLARLVVCGSWIEGIYITTNVALKAKDNTVFLEMLAKQKKSFNQLVSLLEPVRDEAEVADIFKGLSDIQTLYKDVEDTMTDEQLQALKKKITILRESIV